VSDDLDALEAAARAVTYNAAGEWYTSSTESRGGYWTVRDVDGDSTIADVYAQPNAAYIAALHPSAALALIARVKRAEAAVSAHKMAMVRVHTIATDGPRDASVDALWRDKKRIADIAVEMIREARTDGE
jgi:hypothetical protein